MPAHEPRLALLRLLALLLLLLHLRERGLCSLEALDALFACSRGILVPAFVLLLLSCVAALQQRTQPRSRHERRLLPAGSAAWQALRPLCARAAAAISHRCRAAHADGVAGAELH